MLAHFQPTKSILMTEPSARPELRLPALEDRYRFHILLDERWCAFLARNNVLVGLSIDGPADLHDRYRYSRGNKPTFSRVMAAVALLHRGKIAFNALCVVNRSKSRRPIDVYRFLRDQVRPRMIQFIPGLEPLDFRNTDWATSAKRTKATWTFPNARKRSPTPRVKPCRITANPVPTSICAGASAPRTASSRRLTARRA